MANPPFATDNYYHIYNRGVERRTTFIDKRDYERFLETLDFYRKFPTPMKLSDFRRGIPNWKKPDNQKNLIQIHCYCLMPNHFHLLVKQLENSGISEFMRKISDSYTRYFNTKYDRVGSLFQGVFKAKLIETDEYLLQLSKYIHRNSFPLDEWEGQVYPYSSYNYYLSGAKHPFCDTDFISSYFSNTNPRLTYKAFVEEFEVDSSFYKLKLMIDEDDH